MSTILNFKDIFDIPEYRPVAIAPNSSAAGVSLAWDERGAEVRHPEIFQLASATVLNKYNVKNDSWTTLTSPALTGTFGAGATSVFKPSHGPSGTLAAVTHTTTKITLSTALPAAVGTNQLADRGDGVGFTIRIIGNAATSSGKTEERKIIANTSGTTPVITLDSPLTFTPLATGGDRYEILSGRVYMLSAGVLAAGMWKYYDIATNSVSGNLATTNLPATIGTDSNSTVLDEGHTPYTRQPGEGYLIGASTYNNGLMGCLLATGSSATTITGQATVGDAAVVANEFRNFQIRIVEDTAIPTAVGQRRNITSHTAGASPVYTVATWTVTPSTTAKFVIEMNNDRILLFSSASTSTFTYNITANTWDTTTFGARSTAVGAGVSAWVPFAIVKDINGNVTPGRVVSLRGGNVNSIDILDITAATTGTWTNGATYGNQSATLLFTTGTCATYIGSSLTQGRYSYILHNTNQNAFRYDNLNNVLEGFSQLRYLEGGAVVGQRIASTKFFDGTVEVPWIFRQRGSGQEMFELMVTR